MAGGKQLIAAAPLVIVKDVAGVDHYVYGGQPLTASIPDERRKQLLIEGKLVEVSQEPVAVDDVEVPTERPAKNAKVDVWRVYASSVGVEVEGLRKEEIITAVEAAEGSSDGPDGDDEGQGDEQQPADPDAPTIT